MREPSGILRRFLRITSSGRYIREIDSLRFVAISLVVLFHIAGYVTVSYGARFATDPMQSSLNRVLHTFGNGVELFFTISGFVLGLPFASAYLRRTPAVSLSKYYWRRVTRLEPPFFIAIVGTAVLTPIVKHTVTADWGKHLLATLLYSHAFVYGDVSTINSVTWSLEVEVQFYILMPLLACVYRIRSRAIRRVVLAAAAVGFMVFQHSFSSFSPQVAARLSLALTNYMQYFLGGLYLADLYVEGNNSFGAKTLSWDAVSLIGWPSLVWAWQYLAVSDAVFPFATVLLYCAAFRGRITSRVMCDSWTAAVGGMCYTIYLLHMPAIGLFGRVFSAAVIVRSLPLTLMVQMILIGCPLLAVCGAYFLLIEKPAMIPQWPQLLKARLTSVHSNRISFVREPEGPSGD